MSQSRERERQRWYLERFLERTDSAETVKGDDPPGSPNRFRVEGPEGRIEVRVAELLRPRPDPTVRESVRAFRAGVVRAAEREWSSDPERPNVEVWVEFSGHEQTTSSRDRKELAGRLCRLAESELPEVGGVARIVAGRGRDDASFPLVTPALTVARLPTYSGSSWHAISSGPAPALEADDVRRAAAGSGPVDSDETRAPGQAGTEPGRPAADDREDGGHERWLLGVVASYRSAGETGIPDEVAGERYESAFDRIWLFDPGSGEVRLLNPEPREPEG